MSKMVIKNGQQRHETQQRIKKSGLHYKCEYEVDPAVKLIISTIIERIRSSEYKVGIPEEETARTEAEL